MVRNIFEMAKMKGLGDVVEKVAQITKMDKVAKFVAKASGDTSGGCSSCQQRKDTLNKRFPFKK
jgi:hypothetical protein